MILSQALIYYTEKLLPAYDNKQTALTVTWWLLQKATNKTRTELLSLKEISPEASHQIESWIELIVREHMPVQYILGTVPFLDLEITVKQPILIPRPETEQWTQTLIDKLKNSGASEFNALDMCSGTGCIALSLAHSFSKADITASDINSTACELIAYNSMHNKIKNCTVITSDLFDSLPSGKKYSVITCNPPYISLDEWKELEPRVRLWESPQALVAQKDGLHLIEKIIEQAPDYLEKKIAGVPQLWIEIGALQAEKVVAFFTQASYKEIEVLQDLYGKNRVVTGSL